jgi:hypothetical protein
MTSIEEYRVCYYCKGEKLSPDPLLKGEWIIENWYEDSNGQISEKVILAEEKDEEENIEILKTVYYCSVKCMEKQQDLREKTDLAKGKCKVCNVELAVLNDKCQEPEHIKEMKYIKIEAFDVEEDDSSEKCWMKTKEQLKKWSDEIVANTSSVKETIKVIENKKQELNEKKFDCKGCKEKAIKLVSRWENVMVKVGKKLANK